MYVSITESLAHKKRGVVVLERLNSNIIAKAVSNRRAVSIRSQPFFMLFIRAVQFTAMRYVFFDRKKPLYGKRVDNINYQYVTGAGLRFIRKLFNFVRELAGRDE